ncbi:peptidoglycan-associated lipoprotein Pal [Qipengyuania gaetbuli]|uniref:peptidoglycan-associated lipoprotein Pal n=1 Tax=Qipengyuania gaetbuli TaxID=266952 RepID=UPI001CFCF3C7|nr:peptidoglycan-associated lipoprotein Pal [Qipengyuania gaetbuli]
MSPNLTSVLVLTLALGLSACGKKKVEDLPPAPGAAVSAPTASGNSMIPGSQADFLSQMAGQDVIFFDTDRFNIDDIDAAALRSQAAWLSKYPGKPARIEGHADERGTREYNLALGERRANAARNYLISLGIDERRLTAVSYGKERPVELGSNEAAWAKNRRAVTITIDAQ